MASASKSGLDRVVTSLRYGVEIKFAKSNDNQLGPSDFECHVHSVVQRLCKAPDS